VLTHGLSGALAGIAGMMLVLRLGSAIPSIGEEFLLPSFAAPAIGGTLLTGGAVSVFGTVLGGLLVGTIENGLNLLEIPNFWVQLVTGLVLLLAVLLDRARTVAVERSRITRGVSVHEPGAVAA
jgi:ribose transport system permease protein